MAANDSQLPDLKEIDRGLKDFQRRTAARVFQRLYEQSLSSHRFLVADEVGLGKTLIARAVIARTLHHLWEKPGRINIVYICSNADIARQNVKRLNVLGDEGKTLPSRITLLPTKLHDLNKGHVNFFSITPGTSLDLKSSMGIAQERMLLYWIMKEIWKYSGSAPMNVFQGGVTQSKRFRDQLRGFKDYYDIDRTVVKEFRRAVREQARQEKANGERTLRERFVWLCRQYQRSDSRVTPEASHERNSVVGKLRSLLAATCVDLLKPDLIIMDEFQRFKHLFSGEDDASILARQLFEYSDGSNAVRILLLSATPYKMYTLSDESGDENHYDDFIDTLKFLFRNDKKVGKFAELLKEYRYELLRFNERSPEKLEALNTDIQRTLRQVMARTERLAVTDDRAGMLTQVDPKDVELLPGDLLAYVELQSIARELGMPNTIEYWKSSSYLLNFMEDYKLKRDFHDALDHGDKREALVNGLAKASHLLLPWHEIEKYQALDPRNARLRGLIKQVIDTEMWQLLWLPPALSYYGLEGPFKNHSHTRLTKRLIFSSWRVVPKVVSTILSYEAERSAVKLFQPRAQNTEAARERRNHSLLRIAISSGRLSGMPVLALMYPSVSLARHYDPLALARKHGNGEQLSLKQLQGIISEDISQGLAALATSTDETRADEQWYWAAPILLDQHHYPEATQSWFDQRELEHHWAVEESRGEEAWIAHIEQVRKLLNGELVLGRQPDDLAEVMTLFALGGPAVCALRALDRFSGPSLAHSVVVRNAAGKIGWAFRSLFNRVEVTALLRGLKLAEPYWRGVLEYGAEGCLQAVLDEYVHILKDSLGLVGETPEEKVGDIAEAIQTALSVRAAALTVDDIRPENGDVTIQTHRLPSRFAMPFGQGRDEESGDTGASRAQKVREAFNSPFWPFVVTSTSIGQEGLDFHWYSHAIVHWNLPSNPVDLEQREGRVHRYKGHAVRKNIATTYGQHALQSNDKDPWNAMLEAARKDRQAGENDLVPFWIYPIDGGARIERYVPSLPLTQDRQLLIALRSSLAVYRLVFGQPRQDDLVEYLKQRIPEDQLEDLVGRLKIDLRP